MQRPASTFVIKQSEASQAYAGKKLEEFTQTDHKIERVIAYAKSLSIQLTTDPKLPVFIEIYENGETRLDHCILVGPNR